MSSTQVFTLQHKVRELEQRNTGLSRDLAKQREDTRKAGLLFMVAADRYQEEAQKQIRAKAEELADTRKAGLALMNTADTYQQAARKEMKEKAEELEVARKAVLALMEAADAYQQEAKKQIRGKVEELKVMAAQKAELDARVEALEDAYGKVEAQNGKLRMEVERLMMELGALPEEKDMQPFHAGKEETVLFKELEDHKMKVEEVTQDNNKGFGDGEMIA